MMLKAEFIKKPILLISIFAALPFGVFAVALTLPFNSLIELIINGIMAKKTIHYSIGEMLMDSLPAFVLSAIMGAAVYAASCWNGTSMILLLMIQVLIGGLVYVACSVLFRNKEFLMLWKIIRSGKK